MEIHLDEIPDEGLHRTGELPESIFGLDPNDSIRPSGPIHYDARIFRFDDGVAFTGRLHGRFQLQCGTCLEYFDYEADFPDWSSDLDLEPGQTSFDLAEIIREDFLLGLPASPQCDELLEDRVCPRAKFLEQAEAEREEEGEAGDGDSDRWKALDDWTE